MNAQHWVPLPQTKRPQPPPTLQIAALDMASEDPTLERIRGGDYGVISPFNSARFQTAFRQKMVDLGSKDVAKAMKNAFRSKTKGFAKDMGEVDGRICYPKVCEGLCRQRASASKCYLWDKIMQEMPKVLSTIWRSEREDTTPPVKLTEFLEELSVLFKAQGQ